MNTPTKTRGVGAGKAADLTYWEGAARVIASVSKSSKIIVEKSTVPVKTADAIEKVGGGAGAHRKWQCGAAGRSRGGGRMALAVARQPSVSFFSNCGLPALH